MVVWEAMAMALPVVSTRVGDVDRVIEHGRSGYLVDVGDAKAMKEYIVALADDPQRRSEFGNEARRTAVQELDVTICADGHARFYRSCIAG